MSGHQHAEPAITLGLTDTKPKQDKWRGIPDPLPVPLPLEMAVEVVASELLGMRYDLEYMARSISCRLEVIEKTLRDVVDGREAG